MAEAPKAHVPQAQQAEPEIVPEPEEDDVSLRRHIRLLKSEYAKVHKNMALGSELMQLTSKRRQSEVNTTPVHELVVRYPFLQVYEEVRFIPQS